MFFSPSARTLLLLPFLQTNARSKIVKLRELIQANPLMPPNTSDGAALWVRLFESKVLERLTIEQREQDSLVQITRKFALIEPDNSFWKQSEAFVLQTQGKNAEATKLWIVAANDSNWDDHQSSLFQLILVSSRLIAEEEASLRPMRSDVTTQCALRLARHLLDISWNSPQLRDPIRFATVENGETIRKHARSLSQMKIAISICDAALLPPRSLAPSGHRVLLIARIDLANQADQFGSLQIKRNIEKAFLENDSADALASRESSQSFFDSLFVESRYIDHFPSSCLLALVWLPILVVASWLRKIATQLDAKKPGRGTFLLALVTLILVTIAGFSLAGLALVLAIIFSGLTPSRLRKAPPPRLGPLFEVFCAVFAASFIVVGVWLCANFGSDSIILGGKMFNRPFSTGVNLYEIILAFIFLVGPLWAYAQKTSTSHVLDQTFKTTGHVLLTCSLLAAVLSVPICVYQDRAISQQLTQIAQNEPDYYILR